MCWWLSLECSLRSFDGIRTSFLFHPLKYINEKQEGQPANCALPSMYLSVNSVVTYTMSRSTFSHFFLLRLTFTRRQNAADRFRCTCGVTITWHCFLRSPACISITFQQLLLPMCRPRLPSLCQLRPPTRMRCGIVNHGALHRRGCMPLYSTGIRNGVRCRAIA